MTCTIKIHEFTDKTKGKCFCNASLRNGSTIFQQLHSGEGERLAYTQTKTFFNI